MSNGEINETKLDPIQTQYQIQRLHGLESQI